MARIKLVYIGGGSTRAPGTVASLIVRGAVFSGSEIVLVDLDPDHLVVVERLARRMAVARDLDLRITATTDRLDGLRDADIVLASFRPGGFEARILDEQIPLLHGIVGQETQGPGGFFMALRSIAVVRDIMADIERVAPRATLINYTNPVNIVSEAITHHSPIRTISLCEGPITFPADIARFAGLDPARLDATLVGLNHTGWTVRQEYDGEDVIDRIRAVADERTTRPSGDPVADRLLRLAATMGSLPSGYLDYYYFAPETLVEARAKPTTRAQDIVALVPDYWRHYEEQSRADDPTLDPARSRGGIHELELAIDVIDALVNDRGTVWPVNVPNVGGALPGFPDDLVVEVPAVVGRAGVVPIAQPPLPATVRGLIEALGAYQALTAEAAWSGSRRDAVAALTSHPLVGSLTLAETLYDDMANAHRAHLPERLLR
ncbi:MAG TPA: glycoside hydrolase [Methylomirabilota bacterium]|nr:glycoside hydrolase [Methylomirabilota bacterium]